MYLKTDVAVDTTCPNVNSSGKIISECFAAYQLISVITIFITMASLAARLATSSNSLPDSRLYSIITVP